MNFIFKKIRINLNYLYNFYILAQCKKNEFRCDGKKCIPQNNVCDKHVDCADGTDEKKCPRKY